MEPGNSPHRACRKATIGEFPYMLTRQLPQKHRSTGPYALISATRMDWHLIRAEKAA